MQRRVKSDKQCKEEFNVCSMIAMGMPPATTTTTTKPPPPDLPDFLVTTPDPIKPIDDIDLPEEVPAIVHQGNFDVDPPKEEKPEEGMNPSSLSL